MNPQKCDRCDKPAVVHEVTVKSGVRNEIHLCHEHALEAGVAMPTHQPINQLLTQFVISQTGKSQSKSKSKARAKRKACPSCGMTFARFRQSGTLGCADCYEAFNEQLAPLIERAQNGATHHRGKTPRRAGASVDRQLLVQQLVKELDQAVAAEQYERAAQLRDRLRNLDPGAPAAPGGKQAAGEKHD
ncbi:MAG: UvrB/UvrC motif-containing protein [Planctomycetota bacterium]|jgi:protein arginine kinase activator